ncbi:hypothetical protein SJS85_08845 [Aeromonas caviae]|uniref:hypothetical protein n=1 Tax=Aeromonas caviae TaxID=648 RepID=UPI0029DD8B76|nr:hypothetical protein [Aeromonas caviae]MDX7835518.1 hypothetical protein [Aeromonas caviae]
MKRFNCTLADKRGEFGECMEAHNTGRYVLFSDVEKLQRRLQEMLDKSNSTGVAIERAISTGSVLADHPLKSRLELLANHYKREQALADGMVTMADRCQLLAGLLQEARINVDQVRRWGRFEHDEGCGAEAALLLERIDALLAGKLPERQDTEWTDAASTPTAEDYRELQAQHDQVQSRLKGTLVLLQEAHEVIRRVIPSLPQDYVKRGDLLDRIEVALAGQTIGRTLTEGQEFELTTVLQSIANGFSDDPAHDAAALLKRIAGEVLWTGDTFQLPPRQAGLHCNQQHSLAGQVFAGLSAATALSVLDANSAADVVQLMLEAAEAKGGEPCDSASPSSSPA